MKFTFVFFTLFLFFTLHVFGQNGNIHSTFGLIGGATTPGYVPFWLRSNQFGSVPLDNASLSLTGAVHKDYDTTHRIFDWGAGVEGRANGGNKSNVTLIEGYAKMRLAIFELRAGRSREIMGLCDTSLSSGAFAISGNALGIPKIQVSIPEFYTIPFFGRLFAFKGNFAHGILGKTEVAKEGTSFELDTWLHQKSFYGRFGKPSWRLKLYGGFNHQAFWGNEKKFYGNGIFPLSTLKTYEYVVIGKAYGNNNVPTSKIGNHIGSIDMGLEYAFEKAKLLFYHQNFYDIGGLYHLSNLRDGLTGLSLVNVRPQEKVCQWKRMLLEFFYSKNQGGEIWSPVTPSGAEDYYNNYQYTNGWSYKGIGLGNPLIGIRTSIRAGLVNDPGDYFINNRVIAIHAGYEGRVQQWYLKLKASYSMNYGTFHTAAAARSLGGTIIYPAYGIFTEKKQLSTYAEASKQLKKGVSLGLVGALDAGELFYNAYGLFFRISKSI